MVILAGVATGLIGDLMMALLFQVQYLAFGCHSGTLQQGVEHAAAVRRIGSLLIAGAFGGVAWYWLRRRTQGEPSEIDEAVWNGDGRLSFRRCLGTSVISGIVIGMGASIGREAAPKLLGGASASVLADWGTVPAAAAAARGVRWRRGAGRGVQLGGALFTGPVIGLTHSGSGLMVPMMAATVLATAVAFYVDGYSIYSSRLPALSS
jgi:chloride channel protein, CIC family